VISLAEICKGIAKLPEGKKRAQLQEWLDSTLRPWFEDRILPASEPIAERMGRRAREGEVKDARSKITDGMIAATALEHDLTLPGSAFRSSIRGRLDFLRPCIAGRKRAERLPAIDLDQAA